MGIASLILGIISFLVSLTIFKDLSLICGIISIALGVIAIVKKKAKAIAIIGIVLSVIGCVILFSASDSNSNNTGKITSNNNSNQESQENNVQDNKSTEEQVLKVGDTWTVDGQWKLTIDSVKTTTDRNQYSDKDPQQVVIITYSYENLGYESYSDGLYFDLDQGFDVTAVDSTGEVAISYPGSVSKHPQSIPVGAKCSGAQSCIGLMNASDTFTMTIKKYDGNSKSQSVKCNLKVD